MRHCLFCRGEFADDVTHCPNCQIRLVDELPRATSAYQTVEEVPIARYPSLIEAEMSADILKQAGIPCVLIPLVPGAGVWGTSLWVVHELRVRADDAKNARTLLVTSDE
jgi:hypothetical protein